MKKFVIALAVASMSLSTVAANAGGWGSSSQGNRLSISRGNAFSSGLVNVSPSIGLGNVGLLNGSAILSGNTVSNILNGSGNGLVSGILSGIGANILGGNTSNGGSSNGGHSSRHHR